MAIDLTEYADGIGSALADGTPCVLGTVFPDGMPNLGYKGSVMVFDKDHLAFWERTKAAHLDNLRRSPKATVLYANFNRMMYLRFSGDAIIHEQGPVREQVMTRVVQPELDRDPERQGVAVLLRVNIISDSFKQSTTLREV